MAVKLAVLKSGEHVVADIKELIDDTEKVLSLVFENPYVVSLITPRVLFEGNDQVEKEHRVSFYPWIVLSSDKTIAIDPSWVVCVVEPHEMVKNSYLNKMNGSVDGEYGTNEKETLIENFEVITEDKDGN